MNHVISSNIISPRVQWSSKESEVEVNISMILFWSPLESIGVHRSQSSRIGKDKLKSEAGKGCKSLVESIGVHRSQSSRIGKDKLKSLLQTS